MCLIFSTTWLGIRISLDELPPLGSAGVRYLIAAPILFALARVRRLPWPASAREWRLPLLLGLTMFAIPFALIYTAERTVPSGLTAVLFAPHAIFVAILAHIWLPDERLTPVRVLGVLGGFAGVLILFADRLSAHASWLGETAVLLTGLIQATSSILVRRFLRATPAIVLSCIGTSVGAVVLLLASLLFERGSWHPASAGAWLAVLYLAVFGSVIAFTVTIRLLHDLGANRVAMSVYVTPALALIWGALFRGEAIGPWLLAGTALIVFGVALTSLSGPRAAAPVQARASSAPASRHE